MGSGTMKNVLEKSYRDQRGSSDGGLDFNPGVQFQGHLKSNSSFFNQCPDSNFSVNSFLCDNP